MLWSGLIVLAAIGIAAAVARAVLTVDAAWMPSEEMRSSMPPLMAIEHDEFTRWFRAYPATTLLHVVPGALLLLFAPLQFSSRLRARHVRLHRWSGRMLLVLVLIVGVSSLLLGAVFPHGNRAAAAAVFVAGALFLIAAGKAFAAIRRRDIARHREWMIRMFALGIGIATIRVVGTALYAITGGGFWELSGLSFWLGWCLTFAVAEGWIRYTRPR